MNAASTRSNEQVSLDIRLWVREAIDGVLEQLHALMAALVDSGERDPDAVIPGYTHLRRAQAVLWPHYLLAYGVTAEGVVANSGEEEGKIIPYGTLEAQWTKMGHLAIVVTGSGM